jgi:hypothetical protein
MLPSPIWHEQGSHHFEIFSTECQGLQRSPNFRPYIALIDRAHQNPKLLLVGDGGAMLDLRRQQGALSGKVRSPIARKATIEWRKSRPILPRSRSVVSRRPFCRSSSGDAIFRQEEL